MLDVTYITISTYPGYILPPVSLPVISPVFNAKHSNRTIFNRLMGFKLVTRYKTDSGTHKCENNVKENSFFS